MIKIVIYKKMSKNFSPLELKCYYRETLTKKEKSEFLKYLVKEFDYSQSSIQQKMTGQCEMNKRDVILIGNVVENESWKQL